MKFEVKYSVIFISYNMTGNEVILGHPYLNILRNGIPDSEWLFAREAPGIPPIVSKLIIDASNPSVIYHFPTVFLMGRVYDDVTFQDGVSVYQKKSTWRELFDRKVREAGRIPLNGLAEDELNDADIGASAGRAAFHMYVSPIGIIDGQGRIGPATIDEARTILHYGGNIGYVVSKEQYQNVVSFLRGESSIYPDNLPAYFGILDLQPEDIICGEDAIPFWIREQELVVSKQSFRERALSKKDHNLITYYATFYAAKRPDDMASYYEIYSTLYEDRIPRGTMDKIVDTEAISLYLAGLESMSDFKTIFILNRLPTLPEGSPYTIVDIGCMTGSIIRLISESRKSVDNNGRFIGIDVNSEYLEKARQLASDCSVEYIEADASIKLPFENNSIHAISCIGILHELYTQGGLRSQKIKHFLTEAHRCLVDCGRLIIRDPVLPDKPNQYFRIDLSKDNGFNPETDKDLLSANPKDLSSWSLFRKFLLQYKPLRKHVEQGEKPVIQIEDTPRYLASAWIIAEFARKITCNDSLHLWGAEMEEQNAVFTVEDFKKLAVEAGFFPEKCKVESVFEDGFYGTFSPSTGVTIKTIDGIPVDQKQFFPSHLYAVLEK